MLIERAVELENTNKLPVYGTAAADSGAAEPGGRAEVAAEAVDAAPCKRSSSAAPAGCAALPQALAVPEACVRPPHLLGPSVLRGEGSHITTNIIQKGQQASHPNESAYMAKPYGER